jgi:pimeloyl-ACP methyl ester carboxylesterase
LLEARGFEVDVVELAGGDAKGGLKAIKLAACRVATRAAVDARTKPVYLFGHSIGGFTISNVAEAEPNMIKKLIYVAAYVPKSGESLQTLSAQCSATNEK